jgi:hypothetical protein
MTICARCPWGVGGSDQTLVLHRDLLLDSGSILRLEIYKGKVCDRETWGKQVKRRGESALDLVTGQRDALDAFFSECLYSDADLHGW